MAKVSTSEYSLETTLIGNKEICHLPPAALAMIADFFKVLSEMSRLQIICALKNGEKNVSQIIEITALGQANVSKHLKVLTQAGIVTRTQEGVNVFYAIANPLVFPLCDLVCNSVATQLQQQNEQFQSIKSFQELF